MWNVVLKWLLGAIKNPKVIGYALLVAAVAGLAWKWIHMEKKIVSQAGQIQTLGDDLAKTEKLLEEIKMKEEEAKIARDNLQKIVDSQTRAINNFRHQIRKLSEIQDNNELAKALEDAWNVRLRCIELVTGSKPTQEESDSGFFKKNCR